MTRTKLWKGVRGWAAAALWSAAGLALAGAACAYPFTASTTTFGGPGAGQKRFNTAARTAPAPAAPTRTSAPVVTVSRTAPGQTGYVHYFVITGPDGEPETQVGIELPGDRVAWSFPEMGVAISPFMASGQIVVNGKAFEVEHLYGLRPFPDEESMATLRRDVNERIAPWIEQKTPYCDEQRPSYRMCLSCLGFVLRVLYPGPSPSLPALPADFKSARKNMYTTEDLLMYLAGVRIDTGRQARLRRIQAIKVPDALREELVRISDASSQSASTARAAVAKPRSGGRSVVQSPRRGPRSGS